MIANWEKSGNGASNLSEQRDPSHSDFGRFEEHRWNFQDDNRKDYLLGFKSFMLYFWHLCDSMDLLQSALTVMPLFMTASSDGIPLTSGVKEATKRKHSAAQEAEVLEREIKRGVSKSILCLSYSSLQSNWMEASSKANEWEEKAMLTDNQQRKIFYESKVCAYAEQMRLAKIQMDELVHGQRNGLPPGSAS